MKKIILTSLLLMVCGAASLVSAQVVQKAPPPKERKENNMVRLLPDLAVGVVINKEKGKALVTVVNKCKGKAGASRVSLFFYKDEKKKSTEYVVMHASVPPLDPGAKTTLAMESGHIKNEPFLRAVIDYVNEIKEASEGNNWWEMSAQPFPDKGGYCNPPYDN